MRRNEKANARRLAAARRVSHPRGDVLLKLLLVKRRIRFKKNARRTRRPSPESQTTRRSLFDGLLSKYRTPRSRALSLNRGPSVSRLASSSRSVFQKKSSVFQKTKHKKQNRARLALAAVPHGDHLRHGRGDGHDRHGDAALAHDVVRYPAQTDSPHDGALDCAHTPRAHHEVIRASRRAERGGGDGFARLHGHDHLLDALGREVAAHELCGVVVAHALAFRRAPLCDERDRRRETRREGRRR